MDRVYDQFAEAVVEEVKKWKVGDPMDPETMMGPLARRDLYETVRNQVKESVDAGSTVLYGDQKQLATPISMEKGNFFYPMVLDKIPDNAPAKKGKTRSTIRDRGDLRAVSGAVPGQDGAGGHRVRQQLPLWARVRMLDITFH